MFPRITHIDDVLPSVKDRPEFVVADKGDYIVIDYVYIDPQSLDDPIRAECRGLKFDAKTGALIARPFHKFFNFGERNIDYPWDEPHIVMDKMDGTMIHTVLLNGEVRFMTRMGLTEHAFRAEQRHLEENIAKMVKAWDEYTFMFEWTAPDNQIVLRYDESRLTLLNARHIHTGEYMSMLVLDAIAYDFNLKNIVDIFPLTLHPANIKHIQEHKKGIEGFVVYFPKSQQFVKIKTDEYIQKHRAVSYIHREDVVLPAVLDQTLDDIYPSLDDELRDALRDYESKINAYLGDMKTKVVEFVEKHRHLPRKDFALLLKDSFEPCMLPAFFSTLDGKDPIDSCKKVILRNPSITGVKWTIPGRF